MQGEGEYKGDQGPSKFEFVLKYGDCSSWSSYSFLFKTSIIF